MRTLILCAALCVVGCQSEAEKAKELEKKQSYNGVYKVKSLILDRGTYVIKVQSVQRRSWHYFFLPVYESNDGKVADPTLNVPECGECWRVEYNVAKDRYEFVEKEECK